MATHSSIHAWKIQWTEKPGRLQSMGLQRVRHHRVTKQAQHRKLLHFVLSPTGFPQCACGKESPWQFRIGKRQGLDTLVGRSPGVGNCNPFQYSCLENYKGRGALLAILNEATKSQTQLSILKHTDYPQYCKIALLPITLSRKYVV